MKTKNIKNAIIAIVAMLMAISCTGCGNPAAPENAEPVNIAFVVGIADDETKFNEGIDELSTLPARPGSNFAFISAEGIPVCIGEPGSIPDLSEKRYTNQMMERIKVGIKADLVERLTSYEPASAELNIAAATDLAVRSINAAAIEGRQNILVFYCSGKSTTGLIDMVDIPICKLDIEASVSEIAEKMNLNMSDIDEIIWYCCGDFGNRIQPALSSAEKNKMRQFYEQLFYALGAKKVSFRDNLPSAEAYQFEDCPVSCMEVEETDSGLKDMDVYDAEDFKKADAAALKEPVVIPEEQVRFKKDSAVFLSDADAAAAIQPIADLMLEYPDLNILIYGTCASKTDTDTESNLLLGKERADAVRNMLLAAGIEESRVTTVTVRIADDPYYQRGLGTQTDASCVNRKCVLMDKTTELAQKLLSKVQ